MKRQSLYLILCVPLFVLMSFGPVAKPMDAGKETEFLQSLEVVQQARDAASCGNLKDAYRLAKKAVDAFPYNKIIFNESWRIYLICEKYDEAFKISEAYMDYLNDQKKDFNLKRDFYFSQCRYHQSRVICLLNNNDHTTTAFTGIRRKLALLLLKNREYFFLELNDAVEINNLVGVLTVLAQGKCKSNSGDMRHSHVDDMLFQDAYNYFSVADSINLFFDLGYDSVSVNKFNCLDWAGLRFDYDLIPQKKTIIPTFAQTLGISNPNPNDRLASTNMKDSILLDYKKPDIFLDCFSDINNELDKYNEFHFMFDHSNSMNDISAETGPLAGYSRAQVMKESATYFLLHLIEQNKLNINAISVGGECEDLPKINTYKEDYKKVSEQKIRGILDWVNNIEAYGMTPLYQSFHLMNEEIEASKEKRLLVVFSDGVNSCDIDDNFNTDNDRIIDIKNQFSLKNIDIMVISLIPEVGYEDAYGVYRELARETGQLYKFTEDCDQIEMTEYNFKLNFTLPYFELCDSHTLRSDSLCFDWDDMRHCFNVEYSFEQEDVK